MSSPIRLGYSVAGPTDAPLIVFLHGFLGDRRDWDDVKARLGGAYRCLTLDLPGHGETHVAGDAKRCGMEPAAAAVARLLDDVGAATCSLAGYSMGGRLALYFAIRHGCRVDRLLLESASPGLFDETERVRRREADAALARRLETGDFRAFLDEWHRQPLFDSLQSDNEKLQALIARRLANDPHRLAAALRDMGTGSQPSLWARLDQHRIPTLLVVGERDAKFRAVAEAMARVCPAVRATVVPGCGHNVHFEKPEDYTECLRAFFHTG